MSLRFEQEQTKISLAIDAGHNIIKDTKKFLTHQAGFNAEFVQNGALHITVENDPLLRSITACHGEDIPLRLDEGVHEFAVLGRDKLRNAQLGGLDIVEICALGYSPCEVALEVPKDMRVSRDGKLKKVKSPADLDGCKIATSLFHITEDYFRRYGAEITIIKYNGKEEGAPGAKAADAVVAIWRSGATAAENGLERLKGYETILKSEAVLATTGRCLRERGGELIVNQFITRVTQAASCSRETAEIAMVPERPATKTKFFVIEWVNSALNSAARRQSNHY